MTHHYSQETIARRLAYGRRHRRAFVKAGLRSDGNPRAKRKPCGCLSGWCLKCCRRGNKRAIPSAEVQRMHRLYMTGISLSDVGRRFPQRNGKPRVHGEVQNIFRRRGMYVRPYRQHHARNVAGRFVADPPMKAAEINALIAGLRRVAVPGPLHREWRLWPLKRRAWFIKKVRVHLAKKTGKKFAPAGPHSANVRPFDYTTTEAREIVDRLNKGRNSRNKVANLKPSSQGMIYEGRLYFWAGECYWRQTHPYRGYLLLHREIYKQHRGPIPAGMTVIHLDGNKNNFNPANLGLRSMADCARQNAWHRRRDKFPGLAGRIADKSWTTRVRKQAARARSTTALLVQNFRTGRGRLLPVLREAGQ